MIKILILLLLSTISWASGDLQLQFSQSEIKQGSLGNATLKVSAEVMEKVPLNKLVGKNFAESVYFHKISPFLRKEGSNSFESEVQVIFVKTPESQSVPDNLNGINLVLHWNQVQIIPTNPGEGLIFGNFTIPERFKWMFWLSILIGLLAIGFGVWGILKKINQKKKLKEIRLKIKNEIMSCSTYHDVVLVWQNKKFYCEKFPHLEDPFKKLEKTLFKYQFKPFQSEMEKDEVIKAYQVFVQEIEEGFRGI